MEDTFFKLDQAIGIELLTPGASLGWKWNEAQSVLTPILVWNEQKFIVTGSLFRLGQWDQFERVEFLQRLCRLFYHDVNGKITGFDGMIQLWKFRIPEEAVFFEDLELLQDSVTHLKKLNFLMDAGTDLKKVSEFHLVNAISLLDGLTQRVLGIVQPIRVLELTTVRGAAGYTLFLIWTFIAHLASLSTTRSNWKLTVKSGAKWNRDLVILIESKGLPSASDILEGVPQHSLFNRWILMRLASDDLFESKEGEWFFAFNMKMKESEIDQFSIGSEEWMREIFRSSLHQKKPIISEEKKNNLMIQKAFEILF